VAIIMSTGVHVASAPIASAEPASAAASPPVVELVPVAEAHAPVDIAWRTGDASMYVVSQHGTVTRIHDTKQTVVLDISEQTEALAEQGLLGLTFDPNGEFAFVNYTDNGGDSNIVEYAVGRDGVFDPLSSRPILFIDQPYGQHNAGSLEFGPDGMLYIGSGDGGFLVEVFGDPDRRAQNPGDLLGKLLRINVSTRSSGGGYTIPADNPLVGVEGARGEVWALGLRNPWHFSFDQETGDLWIADVGDGSIEEINFAPSSNGRDAARGYNFGWSGFAGNSSYNDDVEVADHRGPIYEYSHQDGRCAVIGGTRGRGAGAGSLAGWYVFADYCTGELLALSVAGSGSAVTVGSDLVRLAPPGGQVTAVKSGPDGTIYVLRSPIGNPPSTGHIYRVDASA
jgi:glucose/arabinose dehydrogenase